MEANTLAEKVDAYVQIRDYIEGQEKIVSAALAPYREAMQILQNQLLELMDKEGVDNIKTPNGTAYRKIADRVVVEDWSQTLRHIIAMEAWELLERRVNPTAAKDHMEVNGEAVPGCKHNRAYVVQIRRAS